MPSRQIDDVSQKRKQSRIELVASRPVMHVDRLIGCDCGLVIQLIDHNPFCQLDSKPVLVNRYLLYHVPALDANFLTGDQVLYHDVGHVFAEGVPEKNISAVFWIKVF